MGACNPDVPPPIVTAGLQPGLVYHPVSPFSCLMVILWGYWWWGAWQRCWWSSKRMLKGWQRWIGRRSQVRLLMDIPTTGPPHKPLHIHALHIPHSTFQVQTDFQAVIFGSRLTTYSSSSIAAKRMSVGTSRRGCLCSTLQSACALYIHLRSKHCSGWK